MALIGYARVSTSEQSLDRQLDELSAHGCDRVFAEAASGRRGAHRPQWGACLGHLRSGDVLVVVELSRLGRNTGDLGRLLDHLDEHHAFAVDSIPATFAITTEPFLVVAANAFAVPGLTPAVPQRDDADRDRSRCHRDGVGAHGSPRPTFAPTIGSRQANCP